jgi:NADH-quinone oxidoreductase subunit E
MIIIIIIIIIYKMEPYNYWRNKLKENGFRLTAARDIILKTILDDPGQKNIEEIYEKALELDPEIGIATVYRNINNLQKIGLLKKIETDNNRLQYTFNYVDIDEPDEESDVLRNIGYLKDIRDMMSRQLKEVEKIKKKKEIKLEEMLKNRIDVNSVMEKYGNREDHLIQILIEVQEEYNWLPKHVLYHISDMLSVPLTRIYNIASFYKLFDLEPRGKHSIVVCTGTACHVRGSMNLLQRIVNVLGVKPGDTTDDLRFTLDTVNCLGVCALGPVMMVDKQFYSDPSTAGLKKIFNAFN